MTRSDAVDRGRQSFARQAWGDAYAQLSAADREMPLEPDDLERLSTAAYLVGRDTESAEILARAHQAFLSLGDAPRAARSAFWLAVSLLERGEHARGGGWLARARRILDEAGHDGVERGYLLVPIGQRQLAEGDAAASYATFGQAAEIGNRFGDRDLVTLARHGEGRALIRRGEIAGGGSLLDEVMVAVTAGEVSPIIAGTVYCSVLSACDDMFDVRRAQEWTLALSRWCESQPDLMAYRGQCLARRAQIMQLGGAWQDAMEEAGRACARMSDPPGQQGAGNAFYQQAELYRLRGEFEQAEASYRQASRLGRTPEPGLAMMRLAQGQVPTAVSAIRRVLAETEDRRGRCRVLAAYVDIVLAAGDLAAARTAADELAQLATDFDAPFLRAISAQAMGGVLLAEEEPKAALSALREAWNTWTDLEAPHGAALTRVLIALACRQLGDEDAAVMELDAARRTFQSLGARPDLTRVDALSRSAPPRAPSGLTDRQVQVLRLVAKGKTNRAVADELGISDKTVARHLSNIFLKLGLSTRAAATAYAYEHDLLERPT